MLRMKELVEKLKKAKRNISVFQPYINYLRFPTPFKGIAKETQIDFDFPVTALVGANGASKTSILQALAGAPSGLSPGNYWFETVLDGIQSNSDASIITGFTLPSGRRVEALKQRIHRKGDPDYWEPARPLKKFQMTLLKDLDDLTEKELEYRSKDRWNGIEKEVLFINCAENRSAFSLYLNRHPMKRSILLERRKLIRKNAKVIKRIFEKSLKSYIPRTNGKNDRILDEENLLLSRDTVDELNLILDKQYSEVHLLHHNLYGWQEGYSLIYRQSGSLAKYSDANAGAGEISTVLLVHRVMSAKPKTLILLDELGSFLHPEARKKVLEFLLKIALKKKHQIVFSTHDRELLYCLPPEAIKLIERDKTMGSSEVKYQSTHRDHAFSKIGGIVNKKQIFCEDTLAEEIIRASLRQHYPDLLKRIEIKFLGGEDVILSRIPEFSKYQTDALLYLDGDQRPKSFSKIQTDKLSLKNWEEEVGEKLLKKGLFKKKSQKELDRANERKFDLVRKEIVPWLNEHLEYLPSFYCPEGWLLDILKLTDGIDLDSSDECKNKIGNLIRTEQKLGQGEDDPNAFDRNAWFKRNIAEIAQKGCEDLKAVAERVKLFLEAV
ncbi:ATP-binding protein [Acetobacteraceae bacterium]|nr:ATP-binding protein [Acetobacteraceae bacterium]